MLPKMDNLKTIELKQDDALPPILSEPKLNQPFSADELKTAWLRFAEQIQAKMPRMYQVMQSKIPNKIDGHTYTLALDSEGQKKDLHEKIYPELMGYLKEALSNYNLELILEVSAEINQENLVYTASDKLTYLTEKNSALLLLKQKFNLDLE